MKFKLLIIFVLLIAVVGTMFTYLNITFEYPTNKVCKEIRDFNVQHKRFPTINEFNSLNVPEVSLLSITEYRKIDGDFLFYFCPSKLGPCEVCTKEEGPYFDEI